MVCLSCASGGQVGDQSTAQETADWPGVFAISPLNDTVAAWPTGICYDPPRTPSSQSDRDIPVAAVMCEHLDLDQEIVESAGEARANDLWRVGFRPPPDSVMMFVTTVTMRKPVPLVAGGFRVDDEPGNHRYGVCGYWETSNGCFEFELHVRSD